jgi:hypothetical protein
MSSLDINLLQYKLGLLFHYQTLSESPEQQAALSAADKATQQFEQFKEKYPISALNKVKYSSGNLLGAREFGKAAQELRTSLSNAWDQVFNRANVKEMYGPPVFELSEKMEKLRANIGYLDRMLYHVQGITDLSDSNETIPGTSCEKPAASSTAFQGEFEVPNMGDDLPPACQAGKETEPLFICTVELLDPSDSSETIETIPETSCEEPAASSTAFQGEFEVPDMGDDLPPGLRDC